MMTAKEFFQNIVEPNFQAFYKDQPNIQHAFNVCVSLNQMNDYAKEEGLKLALPIFKTLVNIATNFKHVEARHSDKIAMKLGEGADIPIDEWGDIFAVNDMDTHGAGKQLIAIDADGKTIFITDVVSMVYHGWKKLIEEH